VTNCEDEAGRQELEELAAMLLYNSPILWENFKLLSPHLEVFFGSPLALFSGLGFPYGIRIGVSAGGYDFNANYGFHQTILTFAVRSGNVDSVRILLENGADDVVYHENSQSGCAGYYSPALCQAVGLESVELMELLLRHGSLPDSPHYAFGTLLLDNAIPLNDKAIDLLTRSKAHIDPVFPRADGYFEAFSGEAIRRFLSKGDLDLLERRIGDGIQIYKPVRDPAMVIELLRLQDGSDCLYYVPNCFAESILFIPWDTWENQLGTKPRAAISMFINAGADINSLDCVVGVGSSDEIPRLEHCTSLDLLCSLEEFHIAMGTAKQEAYSVGISLLKEYGALSAPRYVDDSLT